MLVSKFGVRRIALAMLVCASVATGARAQVFSYPSSPPQVTAEGEPWYLGGEPITWSGFVYDPRGAKVYFNPYEMVRSGSYRGVPLYVRTTLEPYSVVFVPLPGGLLQPYERRRSQELSSLADEVAVQPGPLVSAAPKAASAPCICGSVTPPGILRTAALPEGLNTVFVTYDKRRWVLAGEPRSLDQTTIKVGDHFGFPVYAGRDRRLIYIPLGQTTPDVVVPYVAREK